MVAARRCKFKKGTENKQGSPASVCTNTNTNRERSSVAVASPISCFDLCKQMTRFLMTNVTGSACSDNSGLLNPSNTDACFSPEVPKKRSRPLVCIGKVVLKIDPLTGPAVFVSFQVKPAKEMSVCWVSQGCPLVLSHSIHLLMNPRILQDLWLICDLRRVVRVNMSYALVKPPYAEINSSIMDPSFICSADTKYLNLH